MQKYDFFISYATEDIELAKYVYTTLEKSGGVCFFAPRNIEYGANFASELCNAVKNSSIMVLLLSKNSNNSGYVIREVNTAVSSNKTIIPIRIDDYQISPDMEFFLSISQWIDARDGISKEELDAIIKILTKNKEERCQDDNNKKINIIGPQLIKIKDASRIGFTSRQITSKEIDLEYLSIDSEKYIMNESIVGTLDDWASATNEYEDDTSILLIKDDEIVGFSDFYPLTSAGYELVISGEQMVREEMIDLYALGGTYNAYIAIIALDPNIISQSIYIMFFNWIVEKMLEWKNQGILINKIGISVYSEMLERFIIKFGFEYKNLNPAKGKIFETTFEKLINNDVFNKLIKK